MHGDVLHDAASAAGVDGIATSSWAHKDVQRSAVDATVLDGEKQLCARGV